MDTSPVASCADDVGGPQQAHRLRHDVLADTDHLGEVADAQLAADEQGVEDGDSGRIAEESEELSRFDM